MVETVRLALAIFGCRIVLTTGADAAALEDQPAEVYAINTVSGSHDVAPVPYTEQDFGFTQRGH